MLSRGRNGRRNGIVGPMGQEVMQSGVEGSRGQTREAGGCSGNGRRTER